MNWWHLAQTPDGPYAHQLDPVALQAYADLESARDPDLTLDEALGEAVAVAVEQILAALGFPKRGRWVMRPGWDSSVSQGEPHPNFLQACRDAGHEPGSWPQAEGETDAAAHS